MTHDTLPTDRPAVVTVGLPYANGDLHVGHLRGYVGGDTYARALRRVGQQTAFVCGSDFHGTPIAVNAAEEGVDPETFALRYHEQYEETFPEYNVEFDNYGHTHDETNTAMTRSFVESWIENDHVFEKEIQVAYDPEADQWLPDRKVEGTCPYCGEHARGDECDEGCQRHLEPGEIADPVSAITGNPAEYREREHKFLRLTDFQEYLQGFLDRLGGTKNARNQPREWVEGDLQDLCITRDMDWGIDYPGDAAGEGGDGDDGEGDDEAGFDEAGVDEAGDGEAGDGEDLVLYVWVDAPIEYVSSTKQYTERVGADTYDWEAVWKVGGEERHGTDWNADWTEEAGEIVHVIGRDIIQHHTVFWPAMLRGAGFNEPRAVLATGFVGIDGKALSTSRNRAVWADEYLQAGFHPDLFRYYIVTGAGLESDVDFAWDRFAERVNSELVGNLGNFCYRSLLFAERNYGGAPDAAVSDEVEARIEDALESFRDAVADYDLRRIGTVATDLANFGNEYIQRNEPWHLVDDDPDEAEQVIADCVQLVKACAVLVQPVMPEKAERLWGQLGEPGSVADAGLEDVLATPASDFDEPEELFTKVEDDRVEELTAALRDRVETGGESDEGTAAADESHAGTDDEGAAAEAGTADDEGAAAEAGTAADEGAADDGDRHEAAAAADLEPILEERVGFEEFQELDIRVGRIEVAEPIEGADDLVRLEVDIGVETRQLVAGIRQLHDVDTLPDRKVVVLANLEPAELFGVESNGMVLAAGEQADLLTTHGDAEPGTKIR